MAAEGVASRVSVGGQRRFTACRPLAKRALETAALGVAHVCRSETTGADPERQFRMQFTPNPRPLLAHSGWHGPCCWLDRAKDQARQANRDHDSQPACGQKAGLAPPGVFPTAGVSACG